MVERTFQYHMTRKYTKKQIINIAGMIEKKDDSSNVVVLKSKVESSILKKALIEAGIPEENFYSLKDKKVEVLCLNGGHKTEISDFFDLIQSQIKIQSLKEARLKLENEISHNKTMFAKTFEKTVKRK